MQQQEIDLNKMDSKKEKRLRTARSISIIFSFFLFIYILIFASNLLSSSIRLMFHNNAIHHILNENCNSLPLNPNPTTQPSISEGANDTILEREIEALESAKNTLLNQSMQNIQGIASRIFKFPEDSGRTTGTRTAQNIPGESLIPLSDFLDTESDAELNNTQIVTKSNINIQFDNESNSNTLNQTRTNDSDPYSKRQTDHSSTCTVQDLTTRLFIGQFLTVLTQSSSVTSSVVVSLVASNAVSVRAAYPMIMGANVGTSMTSTIFSLSLYQEKHSIRRAFAAASMHDIFNMLTVCILLPLELLALKDGNGPATYIAEASFPDSPRQYRLDSHNQSYTFTSWECFTSPVKCLSSKIVQFDGLNLKNCSGDPNCVYLFESWYTIGSDASLGVLLFFISLLLLIAGIITISRLVKILLKRAIENNLKCRIEKTQSRAGQYMKECICIFAGMVLTFLLQSSSVFTTLIIPLCVNQVICMKTTYCLILGGNLGTTSTALLSAFAQDHDERPHAFQIWFCHFFFNLTGILLFYPSPKMRWPLRISITLGEKVATYRWFGVLYLVTIFLLLPPLFFALSLAPLSLFLIITITLITVFLFVIIVNKLQQFRNGWCLPACLNTWNCLPMWMHSLQPWDNAFQKIGDRCCPNLSRFYRQKESVEDNIELTTLKKEDNNEEVVMRKSFVA